MEEYMHRILNILEENNRLLHNINNQLSIIRERKENQNDLESFSMNIIANIIASEIMENHREIANEIKKYFGL